MDALELLKGDHERVKSLLGQIGNESGKQQRHLLFQNLRHDLELLAHVEETVFYPAYRNYPDFQDLLRDCYRTRQESKDLLKKAASLEGKPEFDGALKQLADCVAGHLRREEAELFPLVRKTMRRPEREALGRHIAAVKQERYEAA